MLKELCTPSVFLKSDYEDFHYANNLGNLENVFNGDMPHIALMTSGDNPSEFNNFRRSLYRMSANFSPKQIVDIGTVKGGEVGITEVVDILTQKGIFCIVIGSEIQMPHALLRAYTRRGNPIHLSLAESRIDYNWQRSEEEKKYLLDKLIPYYPNTLTRLSYLGYQSYFIDERVLKLLKMMHFETHRLGILRNNMPEVEPILRDSDIFGINVSSIGYTDAPAAVEVNPNGFTAAEACQLTRYAAMSDRLSSMGIYGYCASEDIKGLTALLIAQMVWYTVNGFYQRKNELPLLPEDLIRYEVYLSTEPLPVSFFKSPKSERWWFYVAPQGSSSTLDPEGLISCSYEDYLKTCSGDIPERLLYALERE